MAWHLVMSRSTPETLISPVNSEAKVTWDWTWTGRAESGTLLEAKPHAVPSIVSGQLVPSIVDDDY
jgi:hypothetical protein